MADEALLDTYEVERRPIGRLVLRVTDRATWIATSPSRILRLLRTHVAPRLLPLVLRFSRARAYGFRAVSQLGITDRAPPSKMDTRRSGEARGPETDFPTPGSPSTDNQAGCMRRLAAPTCHLLLCGSADIWDTDQLTALHERQAASSPCTDWRAAQRPASCMTSMERRSHGSASTGRRSTWCGLTARVGYRNGDSDLRGVVRYLARWFPGCSAA